MTGNDAIGLGLGALFSLERERLVRLCAHLCGEPAAAEDLAQETLLEAWRQSHKLRDREAIDRWLSAIARYVCLRWIRRSDRTHRFTITLDAADPDQEPQYALADDVDIELELERDELANLLDRAMALLPAETRQILIARYVEDRPEAEVAALLGISEGAAAMRVQRGKRALRQVLRRHFPDDARSYGLAALDQDEWQATRIWCPICGQGRLSVLRSSERQTLVARCSACGSETSDIGGASYLPDVRGPWRTLLRSYQEAHTYFSAALADGAAPCPRCGRAVSLNRSLPQLLTGITTGSPGVHIHCDRCATISFQPAVGLALTAPQVQRFWRRHRRMQSLPLQEIRAAGQLALLARFESTTDTAAMDIVMLQGSLEIAAIHGDVDEEVA
ncbi:MAG TPA: RNA polymerase sigma factor [Chloroflexota bacterium]